MSIRIAADTVPTNGSWPAPLGRAATEGRTKHAAARPVPLSAGFRLAQRVDRDAREARLLFRLAGGAGGLSGDQPLGAATDWSQLLQLAWDEGATGVLREHCLRLPEGTVPVEVERRLACLVLERELRMRILERRTRESIGALRSAGIDVALLKGAALAATTYGSFTARPMKDVDILVDPAKAEEAKRLMMLAGWASDQALPDEDMYHAHHHLAPLLDARGSRSRLEIHRLLLPPGHPFELPLAELWGGMQLAALDDQPVFVLDSTHHAVHIAIHFAWSHLLRVGGWHAFRDLGAMHRAGMLDWDDLVRAATRAKAASCCYWTLRLARVLTDLHVPDDTLAALAPAATRASLNCIERHFVNVLLRRDLARLSLRLDRALWTAAIEPRQQGHGLVRPWSVSADLTTARLKRVTPGAAQSTLGRVDRVVRCTAYVAGLLWK